MDILLFWMVMVAIAGTVMAFAMDAFEALPDEWDMIMKAVNDEASPDSPTW